ncbi:ABC transporter permease subunit [Methylobacterium aquaticum]|uniref:branched-chain amino acid ABC transporter ATP-binding protein/permease n=1 Tax=Methylobacterium aquaticum TaxID=270351 RepID=UPI003D17A077
MLPGAALGVLVGFASLRLAGPYFAIATLATAEILRLVAANWIELTRGPLGVIVPRPRIGLLDGIGLSFAQYYLMICIVALAAVLLLVHRLTRSPYGRAWTVLRDQQKLAESVGISPLRYRIFAIALSGGIAALAGALLVPKVLVLSPDMFALTLSATGLLAAILGGKGTLFGPVLGGVIFAVVPELLRFIDAYRLAVFAFVLLLLVRLKPGGLASLLPRRATAVPASEEDAGEPRSECGGGNLVVNDLSKRFGGLSAVSGVSFEVNRNEILGIIGPNGAGKTTCLSLISGFLEPTAGAVSIGAATLGAASHEVASQGLVRTFQHTTICPGVTAFENVLIGTHLLLPETAAAAVFGTPAFHAREKRRAAWARRCIDVVGLGARTGEIAGTMAYGEQRMLSIAVALAARPNFLLLDEPAAGLNHSEALQLAGLLKRLRADGTTIVIIDHNLRMMMSLCDRLVVLHHGRLLAQGDPVAIRNQPDVIAAYLGQKHQIREPNYAPA